MVTPRNSAAIQIHVPMLIRYLADNDLTDENWATGSPDYNRSLDYLTYDNVAGSTIGNLRLSNISTAGSNQRYTFAGASTRLFVYPTYFGVGRIEIHANTDNDPVVFTAFMSAAWLKQSSSSTVFHAGELGSTPPSSLPTSAEPTRYTYEKMVEYAFGTRAEINAIPDWQFGIEYHNSAGKLAAVNEQKITLTQDDNLTGWRVHAGAVDGVRNISLASATTPILCREFTWSHAKTPIALCDRIVVKFYPGW